MNPIKQRSTKITIIVEDVPFLVDSDLFNSQPNTYLGRCFSSRTINLKQNSRGEYELGGPGTCLSSILFRCILNYYRDGHIKCPPSITIQELKEACEFLGIPFDAQTIKCQDLREFLQVISNQGARQQFEYYLETLIYPILIRLCQKGDRECHIVVLLETDHLDWDYESPPHTGEQYSEIIYSKDLYKFFKYVENREVAKQMLKEYGLKKLRIGIEGYPTTKDKIKQRPGNRIEIIYNYEQRPFIHMSWEKEEARSRHVDFQCVKISKSTTNLSELSIDSSEGIHLVNRYDDVNNQAQTD